MKLILLPFLLLMLISFSSKAKVKATDVFIGYDHLCITLENDKLLCKGNNKSGQAGLGKIKKSNQLKPVPRINSKIKKISVGGKKACALMDNGNIYCWNHIKNMRKVTPERELPSKVPRIKAVDLDCAKSFCCAASTKGEIKCWGKIGKYVIGEYNYLIKIGAFPSTLSKLGKNNKKVRIIGEPDARKIKVQKKNNSWYVMDYDRKSDQLVIKQSKKHKPITGFGGKKHVISYSLKNSKFYRNHYGKKPNRKVILKNITKSSIVNGTGCFFVKNHYLHCMGNLWKSRVSGWAIKFISKLKAYRISNVKQVSAGYGYFCVLKNNNSVWCYDPIKRFSRSKIHFFKSGLKKVILGKKKSCALKANGSLWCWGKTLKKTKIYKPEILQPFDNSVSNFSMNENHACAIHKKGKIWCWGKNKFGQLGDSTRYYRNNPTLINYTKNFTDIKVGSSHTCGVKGYESVFCWGNNNQGQVANKKPMISKPKYVKYKRNSINKLALKNNVSCTHADTKVYCWGDNSLGILGTGKTELKIFGNRPRRPNSGVYRWRKRGVDSHSPQLISGKKRVKQLVLGSSGSCFLTSKGKIYCWGASWTNSTNKPKFIKELKNLKAISINSNHICGVDVTGKVKCMNNIFSDSFSEKKVLKIKIPGKVVKLKAKYNKTCVITDSGQVWCWEKCSKNLYNQTNCKTKPNQSPNQIY